MFSTRKDIREGGSENNEEVLSPSLSDRLSETLPPEMVQEIFSYVPQGDFFRLFTLSKKTEKETAFLRLEKAAIYAAPEFMDAKEDATALAALPILKRHPELLFEKKRVKKKIKSHDNQEIEIDIFASPYQLFLGAGDIWALKRVHMEILPLILNGETIAKNQFKEQFPNYDKELTEGMNEEERFYDDRNKQQVEAFKKQLVPVKALIEADPFINGEASDATKQAIVVLLKLLQPEPGEDIRSGLHLPLAIPLEAYKTYVALQSRWSYFSLEVIKPVLDALSTVDGQCCQGGLRDLDMEKGPSRRCHPSYRHPLGQPLSLTLVNDKGGRGATVVDPYNGDVLFGSFSCPGYFDCYNKNGVAPPWAASHCVAWVGACAESTRAWTTYGEQKQRLMGAIMRPHTEKSTTASITMTNRSDA